MSRVQMSQGQPPLYVSAYYRSQVDNSPNKSLVGLDSASEQVYDLVGNSKSTVVLAGDCNCAGPVFCLLLRVSSDCTQLITGQVTKVTCPVIGQAQPELTPSKRQKMSPDIDWDSLSTRAGCRLVSVSVISLLRSHLNLVYPSCKKTQLGWHHYWTYSSLIMIRYCHQ